MKKRQTHRYMYNEAGARVEQRFSNHWQPGTSGHLLCTVLGRGRGWELASLCRALCRRTVPGRRRGSCNHWALHTLVNEWFINTHTQTLRGALPDPDG